MRRLTVLTPVLFSFYLILHSQDNIDFNIVNNKSYEHYLKREWKYLIWIGNDGIKRGIDYYYLRMRMGIAYYEQQKYRQSIPHLRKALEFNNNDPTAMEYLYFAYLFSARAKDAELIYSKMNDTLRKKIRPRGNRIVRSFSVNYQHSYNKNTAGSAEFLNIIVDSVPAYQSFMRSYNNFNINLEHYIGSRFSIYHGYTFIGKLETYYRQNLSSKYLIPEKAVYQNQYYIAGNYLLSHGLSIIAAFHYLNILSPGYMLGGQGFGYNYTRVPSSVNHQFISHITLSKELGLFSLGASASYLNLEYRNIFQKDFLLAVYPFGNLNLYLVSKLSWNTEYSGNTPLNDAYIFNEMLGFRLAKWWWSEISLTRGNLYFYVDKYGFIVFNTPEIYKQQFGLSFIFPLKNAKTNLYLRYYNGTGDSYLVPESSAYTVDNHRLKFNIHSISGGIKWNF